MRRAFPITLAVVLLAACSAPVMFRVDVDEPIKSGTLTLNGNSADLMKNVDGAYWAKWGGADASGEIEIVYVDGTTTTCRVGYVTNGMTDIQEFTVRNRNCEQARLVSSPELDVAATQPICPQSIDETCFKT